LNLPTRAEILCEIARRSFWEFCRLLSPDFYKQDRAYLKEICDTLQALWERRLFVGDKLVTNLLLQVPPRHGKSRTLTNFSAWVLGKNNNEKVITASFNDDLAQDFSRHTRDIIAEEKNLPTQIVYSDIFSASIKQGDAAFHKWALEGQFFNYKGTGIGGSITGRGGSVLVVDDPVKDAETAYNEMALQKIWLWYTGTFLSRAEEGAIQIICMTPWAKGDLGQLGIEAEPSAWYTLSMPACDGGKMLCPELLSFERYQRMKLIGDENIIAANYDMQRIDIKGRLYSGFQTYAELPDSGTGDVGYVDTADEGSDYLCAILARQKGQLLYVTDVIYTQEPQEKTEVQLTDAVISNSTKSLKVESNNGGRAFARNVQRMIDAKNSRCMVWWFHQSENKKSRILTNAPLAQSYVMFPEGWEIRWPEFYMSLMAYQEEGKNKHDDAPDALTGLVEHFGVKRGTMSAGDFSASDLGL